MSKDESLAHINQCHRVDGVIYDISQCEIWGFEMSMVSTYITDTPCFPIVLSVTLFRACSTTWCWYRIIGSNARESLLQQGVIWIYPP